MTAELVPASRELYAPVLGKTAVYRLYDAAGVLLYVGIGSDPESRWRDHARLQDWWKAVDRKAVVWRDTREAAEAEEWDSIIHEHPLHNRQRRERVDNGWAASDVLHAPVRVVRDHLGHLIDAAHFLSEVTVVTKNGEPRAALVPYSWYEQQKRAEADQDTP